MPRRRALGAITAPWMSVAADASFGPPPVFVAGVGPKRIEAAGEVGDGLIVPR